MDTPSLIRVTDSINIPELHEGLDQLKSAKHASLGDTLVAPLVVSCKSAVEYLLILSVEKDLRHLREIPILELPQTILQTVDGSQIIDYTEARIGDLVFYHGKWLRDPNVICINHIGMMIDNDGTFYHSTRTSGGFTLSNLAQKVQEGKVATRKQLSPDFSPILTGMRKQKALETIQYPFNGGSENKIGKLFTTK